jgi:membrane fusion protein (multidrug efflux system)
MSGQVDVETREQSGTRFGAAVGTSYRTHVLAQYGADADAEIARIIAHNMPMTHTAASGAMQNSSTRKAG